MLNGRQLRKKFMEFNAQYFNNRLPPYSIRVVPRMTWMGESGRHNKKRKLIEIQQGLPDEDAIGFLIHEMAHARIGDQHGMRWKREMIRLRETGAPLVAADRNVSLDDGDGTRVSERMFRSHVEDELCARPDQTLACAVRDFIRSYGGAETVSEFLNKYRWASAVFKAMQKEFREYQKTHAALKARRTLFQREVATDKGNS